MMSKAQRQAIGDYIVYQFADALEHERHGRGSNRAYERYAIATDFLEYWLDRQPTEGYIEAAKRFLAQTNYVNREEPHRYVNHLLQNLVEASFHYEDPEKHVALQEVAKATAFRPTWAQ